MKYKLFILTLLFYAVLPQLGFTQGNDIRFRQISPPGGFTLERIKCIIQDNLGYMWMGTSQGLIRYDSQKTTWFVPVKNDSMSLSSEVINNVFCDSKNQMWVSTNQGLCLFIQEQQKFKHINYTYEDGSKSNLAVIAVLKTENDKILLLDENYFGLLDLQKKQLIRIGRNQINSPNKLYKDISNRVWIGTNDGNVFRFDPSKNEVKKIINGLSRINSIYSENNRIWLGTEGEGARLYTVDGEFIQQIAFDNSPVKTKLKNVRVIQKDTYGRFWFGTYEGLYLDDGNKIKRFKPDDYPGLPHNSIYEIFEDRHGGLWFGTWSGGVALVHHSDNNFQTFRHSLNHNSISGSKVTSFVQTSENELLIGTELGGLNAYNLSSGNFETIEIAKDEEIETIKSLCKDKYGGIWVGTFRKGLWYRPRNSTKFIHFDAGPEDGKHVSSASIYSLCAVDSGVWIGTFYKGINFYNFQTKSIRHSFMNNKKGIPMSNILVNCILADSKSNLWLGTSSGVLYKIHMPTENISRYSTLESGEADLLNENSGQFVRNSIFHLWEHSSGDIWCGTNNKGILIFNPETSRFKSLNTNGFLIESNVYGIIEDNKKTLWITTNNGLIAHNPETNSTRQFDYSDGIQSNLFCPNAVYKDTRDNLYFGGANGFTKIDPSTVKLNLRKPVTLIHELTTKNNKSIFPVYSSNYKINPVKLNPKETTFRISFSADNYLKPEKNNYKYRLINFHNDWIDMQNDGIVLFTSLDAGEYIFEVRACNNDGIWNEVPTRMNIEIKNYWYRTFLAYFVYMLLVFTLFYFIARFYFERAKLKRAFIVEKTQRENEEQIHEMKLKFFTNISHEFRTPLTLILWPLKRLSIAENLSNEQREELEVVKRNSNRLLLLINQIIDLRKLEKGKSKLNISKTDIIQLIKEVQQGFQIEAKSRNIKIELESPYSSLEIEADSEKLDTILYNLLSNAFKYVSEKGQIKITVDKKIYNEVQFSTSQLSFGEVHIDDFVVVSIEDTGTGIDSEDLLKIFDRFEQGKQSGRIISDKTMGSGIGLSICKEFTLLHNGKITVQSTVGKGSRFTLQLPSKQKAQKILFESHHEVKNLAENLPSPVQFLKDKNPVDRVQILVVEDNKDFRSFICKFLEQYYHVIYVTHGIEALSVLKKHNIDLIVSDVMMPQMDGFEFCGIVKSQIETSHIPVILLTALSSTENLIAGLDKGADAYLTKPFDENVLIKQIENILEQRRRLHKNFSKQFVSQNNVEVGSLDNFFLKRVKTVVEKNILDENFGMEKLAEELMISRSKLHRKIKSLSGLTTSDFVNLIRVKKAVELIKTENYLFSEVAFRVGFSSQSYFTKCFKKVYNVTPKEYFSK